MRPNSQGMCEAVSVREIVSDRLRPQKRQGRRKGGEKETENRAICTFPPIALPSLWCEGQRVTNLRELAGLPFLSRCTCFTTLNTSYVPQGPSSMLFFTFQTQAGKEADTRICTRMHLWTHTQIEGYSKLEWEWRSGVIKMMYWVKVILSLRC